MLESQSDIDDYQYHLGTLWSGMDFPDLPVKNEPASPNRMGMSQCTRAPVEEIPSREFFGDFPFTEDYGSDQGGDSSGNSSGEISPMGNISPDINMSGKMMDFDHSKLMVPDYSPQDGSGGYGAGGAVLSHDYPADAAEEQDSVDGGLKRQCRVCFDVASGYHYGVSSCEACKAFFKRTIQGNIEYSCPAKGECEITKRRRKACQACRFQKCLRVGMLREGVRLDRVRGGRQKYKRNENGTTYIQPLTSSGSKRPYIESGVTSVPDNKYLSTLMALESQLDKVYVSKDYLQGHSKEDVMFRAAVCDVADKELVITISWAKQMPGFTCLELKQQMLLLQNAWLEVMCLNMVWRSCPYQGNLFFAEDLQVPEERAEACQIPVQLDSQIRKVCQRFTSLGVSREEYVLLKAIILCNYDNPDELGIRSLQDQLQDSLMDCIQAQRLQGVINYPNSSRRLGQLLLVLPAITRIKLHYKQFWDLLKMDCRVMMHNLFLEMLESSS